MPLKNWRTETLKIRTRKNSVFGQFLRSVGGSYLSSRCGVYLWISRRTDLALWGLSLSFPEYTYFFIYTRGISIHFLCISKWYWKKFREFMAFLTEMIVNNKLNQAFLLIARIFSPTIKRSSQIMVSSHNYSKAPKGKKIVFRLFQHAVPWHNS